MAWLIASLLLVMLGLYMTLAPLQLWAEGCAGSELEASGAVRARWGPIAIRLARTDRRARVAVMLFRRTVMDRGLATVAPKPQRPRTSASPLRRLDGHIDPVDAVRFIAAQRRHLRCDLLEGELRLGFADPALTGQAFGFLCALRSVLPVALATGLQYEADWSGADRIAIQGRIAGRIFLGRIVLAGALFVLGQLVRATRRRARSRTALAPVRDERAGKPDSPRSQRRYLRPCQNVRPLAQNV